MISDSATGTDTLSEVVRISRSSDMHVLVKATGYHVTAGDVMLAEIIWKTGLDLFLVLPGN
jgi:hypothetical protein